MFMCAYSMFVWSHGESHTSHLVSRAPRDTEATRSVCERLLEREISSLSLGGGS